jgi:hypothetical protein
LWTFPRTFQEDAIFAKYGGEGIQFKSDPGFKVTPVKSDPFLKWPRLKVTRAKSDPIEKLPSFLVTQIKNEPG